MISRVLILICLVCLVQAWTDKEVNDFKNFMKKYHLNYKNETGEFDRHLKAFKDNLKKIKDINNKGYGGQYGVNKFSAMTPEEFKQRLMPANLNLKKNNNIPKFKRHERLRHKRQSIPTSYDYRDYGWVTSVKDQGQCGSCWAFTTAAAFESNLLMYYGYDLDLSEQSLVDCNGENYGCDGGFVNVAIDHIRENGLPLEANYPYAESETGTCSTAGGNRYYDLQYWQIESEADIEYFVYNYGPVAFYFIVPDDFQLFNGAVFDLDSCPPTEYLHEVLIVGYTPDYWITKNSWGTDWGEDGYFYYTRGKNLCNMEVQLLGTYLD